jgi:glycosyltransferase involved in cell wall biosynthesis
LAPASDNLKVLFVQPYFTFSSVFRESLPGNLARHGHDVHVVGYVRDRSKVESFDDNLINLHLADAVSLSISNKIKEFPYFLNLDDLVKQISPDIIHINNLPFLTTFQSVKIAKKLGIPSVVHVHGVIGKSNNILDFAQYSYLGLAGRWIFSNASFAICLTKSDAQEIFNYGCPPEKIRIVPNGVNIDKFKPMDQAVDRTLFWGGRFIPQKGLEYLIEALYLLNKTEPVRIVMTGDGPLFLKIKTLVNRYSLQENVLFRGRVSRDELPCLINSSSVYVLPSLKEGMPFALLEAMSCGKAVVGSAIPGIKDVITDKVNGILVPPRNPKALADAISLLLSSEPLRSRLGHNARQLMLKSYSWDLSVAKVERVYNEALSA